MCHGVYDFIHLGHIEHFKQAKLKGDILVVSITDDKLVEKGQDRPFFRINERIKVLSAIKYIAKYLVLNRVFKFFEKVTLPSLLIGITGFLLASYFLSCLFSYFLFVKLLF